MARSSTKEKSSSDGKKTYILDTNVLLSDPQSIFSFEEHNVVIPIVVLEEIDNMKNKNDEIGHAARTINRHLDKLRENGSFSSGVDLQSGGKLYVSSEITTKKLKEINEKFVGFVENKTDNLILKFVVHLNEVFNNCIFVTRDIGLRVKCDVLSLKAEDYKRQQIRDVDFGYTGVATIYTSDENIEKIYRDGSITDESIIKELTSNANTSVYPNDTLIIKTQESVSKSVMCRFLHYDDLSPEIKIVERFDIHNFIHKNKEQHFALNLLFDKNISLVTITGAAGCGKTFISIIAALEQLEGFGSRPHYEKFIVARPTYSMGPDMGYLPGTLEEKLHPWIAPIRDNISFFLKKDSTRKQDKKKDTTLSDNEYMNMMQEKGKIEVQALSYIRGRSISNAVLLIDEAQNLSIHELKTIITRAGDNCKIILTGDVTQIDNPHLDSKNNGISHVIEVFKSQNIAGHIHLLKGERSKLATIASQILKLDIIFNMGILDKRSRVIDVLLTGEGRRQLASGKMRIESYSFTDAGTFYEGTSNGVTLDATNRIFLEANSLSSDAITLESDDSGKLRPFKTDSESILNGGQITSYSYYGVTGSYLTGSYETSFQLSGSDFQESIKYVLTSSFQNFDNQYIITTNDEVFDNINFAINVSSLNFTLTDTFPDKSTYTGDIQKMDSLFYDTKLSNLQNFEYLPPINKQSRAEKQSGVKRKIGNYVQINQTGEASWSSINEELQYFRRAGAMKSFNFDPTSRLNRLVMQIFEVGYDTAYKLDVIEYGKFATGDSSNPFAHVFFAGKVKEDNLGSQIFVHLFTIVFR